MAFYVGLTFNPSRSAIEAYAQTIASPSPVAGKAADDSLAGGQTGRVHIGEQHDGQIVVPTNQVLSPAGRQVIVGGRPTDVALAPDGRWLAVLNLSEVQIIEVESGKILGQAPAKKESFKGILFSPDGKRLFASTTADTIGVFNMGDDGKPSAAEPIKLPRNSPRDGEVVPVGMAITPEGKSLLAALNMKNTLAEIDLATLQVTREIPVGNAPYDVVVIGRTAYVSNWAGRLPQPGGTTGPSGGSPRVRVDPVRHIANDGSVSVVDLVKGKATKQIVVGLHPSGMIATPDGRHVLVANAHSDTISVIETSGNTVVETIDTKPDGRFLFGSTPNALAIMPHGRTVVASNATNNSVAVLKFAPPNSKLLGCIPTGWYPAGLVLDDRRGELYVANVKGIGSRSQGWKGSRKVKGKAVFGFNSHDYQGTVSLVKLPTANELAAQTQKVLENNRQTEAISALAPPRPNQSPRPVPERHGEPSLFKHVVYIIKENRTYDQVFGDMEAGEGDKNLCIFGREITPNQHKMAAEFVLLDNFYCSGVLSADGHQWTDEAYVSDYIEKAFGGFPRSYPYPGGDAMAYSPAGFLWDNVLAHKRTLRVYGEFAPGRISWKDRTRKGGPKFIDVYNDFIQGTGLVDVHAIPNIKSIEPHYCPTATGFPLVVPDVHRAAQFINELKEAERTGRFANFNIMLLPNDHTSGTSPGMQTPEAAVADNDLALGRIVEAISHSRFWTETCIFVVEDDPQNGFDHIDGHRTIAQVISPYTRRRTVDSTNYNQTSMVRTMELLLGLPPMNQFDSTAAPMTSCFTDHADLTPYTVVPNNIPLDQLNPEKSAISDPAQLHWAQESLKMDLSDVDRADENTFNRILWHARRGNDATYPAWAVNVIDDEDEDEEKRE
ncbi:MAG: bifunctional YncE family protein/alkaline phosphatase family protein [Pirellulales bacterium]|nr:bifunctional YncE family protein/alkaline phosphatase family protein [Pirellulales bacterium]